MTPTGAEVQTQLGFTSDTMSTQETVQHRRTHTADPDRVRVRDDGDGFFRIRMPLASTDEARDGRALERGVVEGWHEQMAAEPLPLFLDHGNDDLSRHRYGALSKVGYWDDPELVERNGEVELEADAVVADPNELDDDVGHIREALAWLRTQAELGLPIASSAGWSEDTGNRDVPGGYDLMEGSIVGIPSDERTTTASADPVALARAVEAASEEFDAETFLRELGAGDDQTTEDDTMTEDTESDEDVADDVEPDTEHDDEPDDEREGEKDKYDRLSERVDELHEKNDRELELLREMAGDGDGDGDDDEDDEDDEDDGEREETADESDDVEADEAEARSVVIDGETVSADEALDRLREAAESDPDPDDSETRDVGDDSDAEDEAAPDESRDDEPDTDTEPSFSFT